ncbi:MAG: bacterial transcriptional activator domain-containing protein [Nitrospirota bacterium]
MAGQRGRSIAKISRPRLSVVLPRPRLFRLVEPFYQRLMLGYETLGRRAEALATYRRCRETLHAQLQIPPSPTTETIHQQIRASVSHPS